MAARKAGMADKIGGSAEGGFTLFWNGPFSQWYPSPFTLAGLDYACAEQFMMHAKAMLFGDAEAAAAILAATHPWEQKQWGRQVRNYDDKVWAAVRRHVVFVGSVAKYTQNPELRAKLFATGTTRMVEASPHDRIWGIGLGAEDPRALDPTQWRGANLLGEVLTEVRDLLRGMLADGSPGG